MPAKKTIRTETKVKKGTKPIKTRSTKRATAQKSSSPTKKKPAAPKTVPKTSRTTVKNNVTKTHASDAKKAATETSVQMPSHMSERAKEKSAVIRRLFINRTISLSAVLRTIGSMAIIVGVSYAVAVVVSPYIPQMVAAVTSSDPTLDTATAGSTTDLISDTETIVRDVTEPIVIPDSEFTLLSDEPDYITQPLKMKFQATYAQSIATRLVNYDTGHTESLPVDKISDTEYVVRVPGPDQVPFGYYRLLIYVVPENGDSPYTKKTNEFFVGSREEEYIYNHPDDFTGVMMEIAATTDPNTTDQTTTDTMTTDSTIVTEEVATTVVESGVATNEEPVTEVRTDDATADNTAEAAEGTADLLQSDSDAVETASSVEASDTVVTEESDKEQITPLFDEKEVEGGEPEIDFDLRSVSGSALSGSVVLPMEASLTLSFIELHARPAGSLRSQFVTLAIKRLDRWVFVFDTKNLPNGEYDFFARTKHNDSLLVSKTRTFRVSNTFTTTGETEVGLMVKKATDDVEREVLSIAVPETDEVTPVTDPVTQKVSEVLQDDAGDFDDLLQRYSVAVQTGDETLLRSIDEQLSKKQEAVVSDLVQDSHTRDTSDQIAERLQGEITDLRARITAFEELRKERSAGETAVDTDADGVSDIDETRLYGTDPKSADTDNDGVPDGAEIMGGYNPTNAAREAVVRFESPKETVGLVRDDVLRIAQVTAISPAVPVVAADEPQLVATEIKGQALPNSFVTLYVFSTPTVVTVRTDADGMFEYVFDKELADGEHEVYVAVTDNAGKVLAHSNPFSFVKEAQAFTPAAEAASGVVSPDPVTASSRAGYDLAIGFATLAFGLLLFVVGVSLRRREDLELAALTASKLPVT